MINDNNKGEAQEQSNDKKESIVKRKRNDDEEITIEDAIKDSIEQDNELYEEALNQYDQKWGEEDRCTFDKGYITQPVYACKNCPNIFGFCYGCSMHCHIDHEIYELFKKRSFRCDCGTNVTGDVKCILQDKVHQDNNSDNQYNHNFEGKYCYCDQGYDYKEDMVQCLFCYDWFHETCIKLNSTTKETVATIPEADEMQDFICLPCLKKYPFLLDYPQIRLKEQDINNNNGEEKETTKKENGNNENNDGDGDKCKREINSTKNLNDLFCKYGWRDELCKCQTCMKLYQDQNILFIFDKPEVESDDDDDVDIQQQEGGGNQYKRIKRPDNPFLEQNMEKSIEQFQNKLTDQQQEKLFQGYQEMKSRLFSFLTLKTQQLQQQSNNGGDGTNNIVITKQDISSLFKDLSNKR